jgi:hypothetical protein
MQCLRLSDWKTSLLYLKLGVDKSELILQPGRRLLLAHVPVGIHLQVPSLSKCLWDETTEKEIVFNDYRTSLSVAKDS